MTWSVTPGQRLFASAVLAVAVAALMLWFALAPAWLGLDLRFDANAGGAVVEHAAGPAAAIPQGAVIAAIAGAGDSMPLEAIDFTPEPDGMATFAQYHSFMDRQGRLSAIQSAPEVTLTAADGQSWTIRPAPRTPLGVLPADFWIQISVGVFSFLIAASIWAFRPDAAAPRYLMLSGLATLMFACLAAPYSTRELALPETLFRWLSDLNFLGGTLFGAALVALMLHYPRRLAPYWVGMALVALYAAWWAAQQLGAFESLIMARRIHVLAAIGVTFILAGVHWYGTRRDPVARAALQWFLLSWLVCTAVFAGGIFLPQMFGLNTAPYQGYAFLLFLLLYVGLAFGITRFRLFELGEWWMRSVIWAISIAVLVALDLVFVLTLQLSGEVSLALALLICGLVWLPLRAWLWGRFFRHSAVKPGALFEPVVSVGLAKTPAQQAESWRALLQRAFEPLQIAETPEAPPGPMLQEHGLALLVPGAGGLPPMRLEYARGGRRLFTRADEAGARDLLSMLRHVFESRSAYEQGVSQERRRIAGDIHDNVGARLLSALHVTGEETKNSRIRETLTDLGRIINDVASQAVTLDEALADLRLETAERLEAVGMALDWPVGRAPALTLSPALIHALRSIVREAVSNAIRHSGARAVRVNASCADGALTLSIEDDGRGFDPASARAGNGMATLRARAQAHGGAVAWSPAAGGAGACVMITLPVSGAGGASNIP